MRILVTRLGAMGDIVHALPAVASLKRTIPGARVSWAVAPKWLPLLEGNPDIDRAIAVDRASLAGLRRAHRELRAEEFDLAVDFQGLLKSALVAAAARPAKIYGFDASLARERAAALVYTHRAHSEAAHVVDRNLDLALRRGLLAASSIFRSLPASWSKRCPRATSSSRLRSRVGGRNSGRSKLTPSLRAGSTAN